MIQNQQAYLVEAIEKVPEFNKRHKSLMSQSEEISSEVDDLSKQIVELDHKISKIGSNDENEKIESELLDDVEKLEANLEVAKDYYAKRETEISTQLGTEAIERAQNQSLHENQKAREETLRNDLENLKFNLTVAH